MSQRCVALNQWSLRIVPCSIAFTHLRAQIACYELKGDLSPVMLKEIYHESFEHFEITRIVWKTMQAWLDVKSCFSYFSLKCLKKGLNNEQKPTRWVWLIVAGRGSRVQSRGRGSNVAVAGSMSRSRVQSRGRGSNVAAGENDLGFEVTEWKRVIWKKYKGKKIVFMHDTLR